jgi:hypothetical protein
VVLAGGGEGGRLNVRKLKVATGGRVAKGVKRLKVRKLKGGRWKVATGGRVAKGVERFATRVGRFNVGRLTSSRLKGRKAGWAEKGLGLQATGWIDRKKTRGEADEEREREEKGKDEMVTVVWYCASTGWLHAGYRVRAGNFVLAGAREQRPRRGGRGIRFKRPDQPDWIEAVINQPDPSEEAGLAARLDLEILRIRADWTGHDR